MAKAAAKTYASARDVQEAFSDLPEAQRAGAIAAAKLLCDALELTWVRAVIVAGKLIVEPESAYAWLAAADCDPKDAAKLKQLLGTKAKVDHAEST